MAKLLPGSIDLSVNYIAPDWKEQRAYANAQLDAMQTIKFPMADGYAVYQVVSVKPPVLKHVNIGDGYQITAAYVRGLSSKDIQKMLDAEAALKEIFGG